MNIQEERWGEGSYTYGPHPQSTRTGLTDRSHSTEEWISRVSSSGFSKQTLPYVPSEEV